MPCDDTSRGRDVVQLRLKIRAEEGGVFVELDPLALGANAEECLTEGTDLDRSIGFGFGPQCARIDFVPGTVARVDIAAAGVDDETIERDLPTEPVAGIGSALARVRLKPDQLLF